MSDTIPPTAEPTTETRRGSGWSSLERIGGSSSGPPGGAEPDIVDQQPGPEPVTAGGEPSSLTGFGLGGLPHGGGASDVSLGGAVPSAGRGFALVLVGLVDDDHEWVRSRERLSADIYTRQVALRYAAAKARVETERGYIAVINPLGRCIGVFTTGTGRTTGPETTKRVRRVLQRNGQTKKRTSRPSKRTSRG